MVLHQSGGTTLLQIIPYSEPCHFNRDNDNCHSVSVRPRPEIGISTYTDAMAAYSAAEASYSIAEANYSSGE